MRWSTLVPAMVGCAVLVGSCLRPAPLGEGQSCASAAACDDHDPCTFDSCSPDGLCEHQIDDAVALPQVVGDCRVAKCEGGEIVSEVDPGDYDDDGESCSEDLCDGVTPTHEPRPNGSECEVAGHAGLCQDGVCEVECTLENAADKCDDHNGCTVDSCDTAEDKCDHDELDGVAAADEAQIKGDCHLVMCETGKEVDQIDDEDLPEVQGSEDCQEAVCSQGMPFFKMYAWARAAPSRMRLRARARPATARASAASASPTAIAPS